MATKRTASVEGTGDARAAAGRDPAPSTVAEGDPLVMLMGGYFEDRRLLTGAVVQLQIHPPGTIMPLSQALALRIDDYRRWEPPPPSSEFVSGPMLQVRGDHLLEH